MTMYFQDAGDGLYQFPDNAPAESYAGLTKITKAQYDKANAPAVAAQSAGVLKGAAQAALDKSDITMLRCVEAGVPVPAEWNAYRKALRAIANGTDTTSTVLPTTPAFVAGT